MTEKIRYCRICGAKLSAGAKFCMACDGKANSLLGGMTVGFAIITALSSLA